MTDKVLAFNVELSAPDAVETVYLSPTTGNGTKIKAFTVTNDTESSAWFKAYIYASTGVVVKSIVPLSIVVRDRACYAPSAIGQAIPAGGTLRIESSASNALNFYVTGVDQ